MKKLMILVGCFFASLSAFANETTSPTDDLDLQTLITCDLANPSPMYSLKILIQRARIGNYTLGTVKAFSLGQRMTQQYPDLSTTYEKSSDSIITQVYSGTNTSPNANQGEFRLILNLTEKHLNENSIPAIAELNGGKIAVSCTYHPILFQD